MSIPQVETVMRAIWCDQLTLAYNLVSFELLFGLFCCLTPAV